MRKTALWAVVILSAVSAAAAREVPAATTAAVGDEKTPAPDLAGYRLCPECNTLNKPEAEFCARCGAALDRARPVAWPRTPFSLSLEFSPGTAALWYVPAGIFAYDGGRWGDEFTAFAVGLANDVHIYFKTTRLRPYAFLLGGAGCLTDFYETDWALAGGGGVRYGYGALGSYVYGGLGLGASRFEGEDRGLTVVVKGRATHYFLERLGVSGSCQFFGSFAFITFGPALVL